MWDGPLGSFGHSESPPRMGASEDSRKLGSFNPSPRSSPPHSHEFNRYPPASYFQQDFYAHGRHSAHQPSRRAGGPSFHEVYGNQMWSSPQMLDESFSPPSSSSSPSRRNDVGIPSSSTPDNFRRQNPFRSPVVKPQRSPFSPALALSGSFGAMTSPDPRLSYAFSPVDGTPFEYLEQPSHSFSSSKFSNGPDTTRNASSTKRSSHVRPSPLHGGDSYSRNFATAALQGVSRSPLQVSDRRIQGHMSEQSKATIGGNMVRTSPVALSSDVKPTQLWQEPSSQHMSGDFAANHPASLRLELGPSGRSSSRTQHSLDGINSLMRSQSATKENQQQPQVYGQRLGGYHHSRHHAPYPSPQVFRQSPLVSTPKSHSAIRGHNTPGYPSHSSSKHSASRTSTEKKHVRHTDISKTQSSTKRQPCNCRKSKCLKLYCDCFSSKRYCDGCKCTDCRNTSEFDELREKAIKDVRSKNSMAFQEQVGGCRCKRSACLKKYCEVRVKQKSKCRHYSS